MNCSILVRQNKRQHDLLRPVLYLAIIIPVSKRSCFNLTGTLIIGDNDSTGRNCTFG